MLNTGSDASEEKTDSDENAALEPKRWNGMNGCLQRPMQILGYSRNT